MKRDLLADKAICEGIRPGEINGVTEQGRCGLLCTLFLGQPSKEIRIASFAEFADANFHMEAREGWPYAIERAIEDGKRVVVLEDLITEILTYLEKDEMENHRDHASIIRYICGIWITEKDEKIRLEVIERFNAANIGYQISREGINYLTDEDKIKGDAIILEVEAEFDA